MSLGESAFEFFWLVKRRDRRHAMGQDPLEGFGGRRISVRKNLNIALVKFELIF